MREAGEIGSKGSPFGLNMERTSSFEGSLSNREFMGIWWTKLQLGVTC